MKSAWVTIVAAVAAGMAAAGPTTMSVQVRSGQVRASASFLGAVVAEVTYGTVVVVEAPSRPWMRVRLSDGKTGWMHESALTRERLQMKAGGDVASGANVGEVALAAKGFTKQIEQEYRGQNPALNFAWVDRMETFRVTPAESQAFLRAGRVGGAGGGVR